MKNLYKIIIAVTIVLLLLALNYSQQNAFKYKPYNPETAGLYELSHPFLLKTLSLGNQQSMADYLWIKLILKIGESESMQHDGHEHHEEQNAEHQEKTIDESKDEHTHTAEECNDESCKEHHHGPKLNRTKKDTLEHQYLQKNLPKIFHNYLNTITDIDPKFAYPYHTAIVFSMFNFRDYEKTEYWMEKAIKNNPEYWEFHFYKAFYLFRIKPSPDSVIIQHLKNSVEAPKSLRIFHKNISLALLMAFNKKVNPIVKQIIFLEGLLETVEGEQLKEKIIIQINELKKFLNDGVKSKRADSKET
ncbi:MAG: hypothetical protein KAR38_07880 [Calditrichia bacterium]|nr:hypothetical protein [Calditrichia bacterium]